MAGRVADARSRAERILRSGSEDSCVNDVTVALKNKDGARPGGDCAHKLGARTGRKHRSDTDGKKGRILDTLFAR